MTKRLFSIAFILCILPALLTASYPFKISVEIYGDQHLIGTPVMAKVTIQNATGELQRFNTAASEGKWYMGGKLCGVWIYPLAPPASDSQKPYVWEVPADWKAEFSYDLASRCELKSDGVYTLEYRYAKVDGTYWADPAQVDIQIQKPIGEDKLAYDSYQACLKQIEKKKGDSFQLCKNQLLVDHPTSIYAAWVIFKSLGAPDEWEPEKLKELFSRGRFPQPTSNSVPYPEWDKWGGWKELSGEDYARWQMNWAERILQNHPDFAFARRLKLLLGVYNLQMKQEQSGRKWLEDVAKEKETPEGQWAQHFMEIWKTTQRKP